VKSSGLLGRLPSLVKTDVLALLTCVEGVRVSCGVVENSILFLLVWIGFVCRSTLFRSLRIER